MNTNKRNIYLLLLINFLQSLVFYAGISTIYRLESGIKLSDIFVIESISWIITFLLEIPFGKFSDRYGYKTTIILGNLMFLISKIIFYKATSFPLFLCERIILSIAIAALSGSDTALLFESSSNGTKYYGYLRAVSTIGLVLASFIAPLLITKNIRLTGLVTIFPYGLAFILSFLLRDHRQIINHNRQTTISYLKNIVKKPDMLVFIILTAIITEISFSVGVVLNQSQYIRCGLNIKYFSIIFAFMQFIPVVSAYTHKLVSAIGKTKIISITVLFIILACLTLVFTNNIFLSILSIFTISLASSIFLPLSYNIQNSSLSNESRATYLSIYAMIMEIISVVFNIVIGKIADVSLSNTFIFMIISLLIFSITYIFIKKRSMAR